MQYVLSIFKNKEYAQDNQVYHSREDIIHQCHKPNRKDPDIFWDVHFKFLLNRWLFIYCPTNMYDVSSILDYSLQLSLKLRLSLYLVRRTLPYNRHLQENSHAIRIRFQGSFFFFCLFTTQLSPTSPFMCCSPAFSAHFPSASWEATSSNFSKICQRLKNLLWHDLADLMKLSKNI